MNYKCKFCGYRFKDKYEQICPECLTAREEDISCGIFGEEEHSHRISSADLERENMLFPKNDTFKESRNEFLDDERRDEKRTSAARYEKMEQKQAAKQQKSNTFSNTSSVLPQQTVYSRQPYNPSQTPMRTNNNLNPNQQNPNNSKGCGCGCLIIVLAIIAFAFADKIKEIDFESLFARNEDTSTKEVTMVTGVNMTDITIPEIPDDITIPEIPDVDVDTDMSKYFRGEEDELEILSEDGTYSIAISDWSMNEIGYNILSDAECSRMTISNEDETKQYRKDMDKQMSRFDFTVKLYSNDPDNEEHNINFVTSYGQDPESGDYYDYYVFSEDFPDEEAIGAGSENTRKPVEERHLQAVYCEDTENRAIMISVRKGENNDEIDSFFFNVDESGVHL